MAATEQSALLARATGDHASVASSALVGVFNNFGNKTANARTEMGRLSDVMATTQAFYAFEDLQGYTDGLKNAAGTAIAMGAPFEQLSPLVGQLNSNMIQGPEAGTALKTVMAQLGNASGRLGFDIARTSSGGLDLITTLENIRATGASGVQLMKAFGTEAGPAVGILTENLAGVKAGFEAVQKGAGATLEGAEKVGASLQARIEALQIAQEALSQKFGAGANVVRGWGVSVQTVGVRLGNLVARIPGVGEGLLAVAGGFGQVASTAVGATAGFFQFSSGIASTMVMVQQFGGVKSLLQNSLGAVRASISMVGSGFVNLGKQFLLLIPKAYAFAAAHWAAWGPIALIIGGVAAVGVAIALLVKHWDTVTAALTRAWGWFSKVKGLFSWLPGMGKKSGEALTATVAGGMTGRQRPRWSGPPMACSLCCRSIPAPQ